MAEFLREQYKVPDNLAILCRHPVTREYDVSWSVKEEDKIARRKKTGQQIVAESERAKEKRFKNREYYLRSRDRAKMAKMALVVQ